MVQTVFFPSCLSDVGNYNRSILGLLSYELGLFKISSD